MYRAEDGNEYGPYTAQEIRMYIAQRRIMSTGWIRLDEPLSNGLPYAEAIETYSLNPQVLPGHLALDIPATVRVDPKEIRPLSKISHVSYCLIAILSGILLGFFGIHNLVAGNTRGIVQLGLGVFGVWGF
jgi:hypothetical protein